MIVVRSSPKPFHSELSNRLHFPRPGVDVRPAVPATTTCGGRRRYYGTTGLRTEACVSDSPLPLFLVIPFPREMPFFLQVSHRSIGQKLPRGCAPIKT